MCIKIFLHLYIIDGVSCVWFHHKILRIGPKGLSGARCQSKAGTLACAGRRPAYMLWEQAWEQNMIILTFLSTQKGNLFLPLPHSSRAIVSLKHWLLAGAPLNCPVRQNQLWA